MSVISAFEAVEKLKAGQVVALPTETVYGLAGSTEKESALEAIFKIKSRPLFDPLIVHVLDAKQAQKVCAGFGDLHQSLAKKFWPGPLTLVGTKATGLSELITAGQDTVAVRSPRHPLFREVLKKLGEPLAAPSANRFQKTSPTRADHVLHEFNGSVPVVDGGECEVGLESTIVQPQWEAGEITLTLYRPGQLLMEEIVSHLKAAFGAAVRVRRGSPGGVQPGSLKDHYQPERPLILVLDPSQTGARAVKNLGYKNPARLELSDELSLSARQLYSALRESSAVPGKDSIFLERPVWWLQPEAEALRDRLLKASTHVVSSPSGFEK